jgi:hypothetical protein
MEQPPGFKDPAHPDWVCEVNRTIYSLKQLPRQWNIELDKGLCCLGLSNSKYNPTLYFKIVNNKLVGALTAHVDDLAIVGKHAFVNKLIEDLGKQFKIGSDEDLHHFLSIKITRDLSYLYLYMNQSHYIHKMCTRFLQGSHNHVTTPTNPFFKSLCCRAPDEAPLPGPYNQLIGSMLWVSQCTRLDVSFAINRLSQHLRDSSKSHWSAAVRVLNYLVSTKDLCLCLGGQLTCSG